MYIYITFRIYWSSPRPRPTRTGDNSSSSGDFLSKVRPWRNKYNKMVIVQIKQPSSSSLPFDKSWIVFDFDETRRWRPALRFPQDVERMIFNSMSEWQAKGGPFAHRLVSYVNNSSSVRWPDCLYWYIFRDIIFWFDYRNAIRSRVQRSKSYINIHSRLMY